MNTLQRMLVESLRSLCRLYMPTSHNNNNNNTHTYTHNVNNKVRSLKIKK